MQVTVKTALATIAVALFPWTVMAEPTVYVPLGAADGIAVVDAGNDTVVGEIPDVVNTHGLAITPDGHYLVAGGMTERPLAVPPAKPAGLSEAEHQAHHALPTAGAELGSSKLTGTLYLIDAEGQRVIRQIELPGAVHHNAVTPDGRYALSTHPGKGGISVVDIGAAELIKSVATGSAPNYVVVTRDGGRLYVSNTGNNTVSEVDPERWIVRRNFPVGAQPEHLALSADERSLYVVNVGAGTVEVLALDGGAVVKAYPVGAEPHGVDLSDDGQRLFVSSKGDNRLVAINLATGQIQTLPLAPAPYHVTAVSGTGKLYVSSRAEPKVWVIDQQTLTVSGEFAIRGTGHEMAIAAP